MNSPVIKNIRTALGRTDQTPISPRPAIFPARAPQSINLESELFLDEIRKLSGTAQRFTPDDIHQALRALISENDIHKATIAQLPRLDRSGIENTLLSQGVELVPPNASKHEMAQCDLGITSADYLLPETGTLVLRSSAAQPRAVSLLPRIHLAIVRPDMLRADLHQVFAETKDNHYLVFITGPSRTADIEMTVTLGVHGPKKLVVWMLEA